MKYLAKRVVHDTRINSLQRCNVKAKERNRQIKNKIREVYERRVNINMLSVNFI